MSERKILNTGPSPRGWHRLQSVLECPQKYAFQHELGISTMDSTSPPLVKGSMMHLALAQHYNRMKNRELGLDEDEWEEPITAMEKQAESEPAWKEYLQQITDCYHAYVQHYPIESFKVLEVEQLAYTKIFDQYLFTGRFDLVVEDRAGRVWVVDHKTTTRIMARQVKYYGISGQLVGYAYMGQLIFGDRFAGMLLNQVQHTGKFTFKRVKLPPAPNLMERFPYTVKDAEERIKELQDSGRKPNEWPMAMNELTCYHRYGACKFLESCQWGTNEN